MINHADEWRNESCTPRQLPQEETVCQRCPHQHHNKQEEPCYRCEDNPDLDPCVLCPAHQASPAACEGEGGNCEHWYDGTVLHEVVLERWMKGD